MSLTKSELEEINQKLQEALRAVISENALLHQENRRLRATLNASTTQLDQWTERYRKLCDYVTRLRAWMNAQGK